MSDNMTLDPPGSITVIGGGPLGIEAALYGRYLGYNVTLIEAEAIGHSLSGRDDEPVPMLPDRCLSPLAISAINAQSVEAPAYKLPETIGEWINTALIPLTETDLLSGRVMCPLKVTSISTVPVEASEEVASDEQDDNPIDDEPVPPDFRLTLSDDQTVDAEAVILAIGAAEIPTDFELPADYFFRIQSQETDDAERQFLSGLKQIVDIYAQLADRDTLNLYLPQRGTNPS